MRNRIGSAAKAVLMGATVVMLGCQGGTFESAQSAALDSEDQKASYAIGLQVGGSLAQVESHIDMSAFLRGIQDAMDERDPVVPAETLQVVMQRFSETVSGEQQAEMSAVGETNRQEGAAYLAQNAEKDGVTTTESGLQYEVMRAADGPKPGPDDQVTIHYRGTLLDGTQFDSSYDRGEPTTFGVGGVIPGFSEALQLMSVGSQYRFVIPGDLAYGPMGQGGMIGPNATLIFEVELIGIPQ